MRRLLLPIIAGLLPLAASSAGVAQSQCRYYLASQHDWGAQTGFYLDLEGDKLAELPLILGVADGKSWRFPQVTPGFVAGRTYRVQAVVAPDRAQLFLDGKLAANSQGGFRPAPGKLEIAFRPPWATGTGDWLAMPGHITVSVAREGREVARRHFDLSQETSRPVPLQLFQADSPRRAQLEVRPGDTVTIEALLRFGEADLTRWAPLIDPYGQCRYAEFAGKVRNDADLGADLVAEEAELAKLPPSPDFDRYGGYRKAGWKEEATGFFRVAQRNGYWFLISPEGNPCFYLGVCAVPAALFPFTAVTGRESVFTWLPPREEPWARAWGRDPWGQGEDADVVSFYSANLIRKYGRDWLERAEAQAVRRLRAFAFSGGGKWGGPAELVQAVVLSRWRTPRLARHPDVFDPAVREAFRAELEEQIKPHTGNPLILGWSVGSEKDELLFLADIEQLMKLPGATPAKRALLDHAVDQRYGGSPAAAAAAWGVTAATREELYQSSPAPPPEDLELMRRYYADQYYRFCYETVKAIDPNHLYLGCYICPGCPDNDANWQLIARHCDVMSYDRYTLHYDDGPLARLQQETGRPHLCGEFSFPAWYDGWRGFGRYQVSARDDAEAGELYTQMVRGGATDPFCVGLMWFKYRDQPLTGRGPGYGPELVYGEHFAFGLVTETDRVKWDLVRRMREANLSAIHWRLEAAGLAGAQ